MNFNFIFHFFHEIIILRILYDFSNLLFNYISIAQFINTATPIELAKGCKEIEDILLGIQAEPEEKNKTD